MSPSASKLDLLSTHNKYDLPPPHSCSHPLTHRRRFSETGSRTKARRRGRARPTGFRQRERRRRRRHNGAVATGEPRRQQRHFAIAFLALFVVVQHVIDDVIVRQVGGVPDRQRRSPASAANRRWGARSGGSAGYGGGCLMTSL